MIVVDAQIHLWAADTPARPWPGGRSQPHRPGSFLKDDALKEMDAAGVARAVIVPPSWEGDRNDLALEAARLHPERFAIMGRFAIERPEHRAVLDGWKRQPGMLGLRFTFGSASQRPWLTDGTADWFWPVAERLELPLMLSVPGSLPHLDRIAERHPGLRVIVDHMGLLQATKRPGAFAHLPELLAMAKRPNVAVKDLRAPVLFDGVLSVPRRAPAHSPGLRRLRSATHVLGHRPDAAAVLVSPGCHALHGGASLARGERPGAGDGPRPVRVARLAAIELTGPARDRPSCHRAPRRARCRAS